MPAQKVSKPARGGASAAHAKPATRKTAMFETVDLEPSSASEHEEEMTTNAASDDSNDDDVDEEEEDASASGEEDNSASGSDDESESESSESEGDYGDDADEDSDQEDEEAARNMFADQQMADLEAQLSSLDKQESSVMLTAKKVDKEESRKAVHVSNQQKLWRDTLAIRLQFQVRSIAK